MLKEDEDWRFPVRDVSRDDLAHTVVVQAEQIAAVFALHEHWVANGECEHDGYFWPCPTVLALGVTA